MTLIADNLKQLESADQAAFYTSGRTSNEAAFLYQLFVRQFGTNNLPDCSNMCHESSGVGLSETIGIGKGSVSLDDLEHSEAIFIFGQNPGSNHPRMLSSLQAAKRQGAKIVAINPLDETGLKRFKNPQQINGVIGTGTALRDLYLPIKINGDVPFLKGLCKVLLERQENGQQVLDNDFIHHYCHNFDGFKDDILNTLWADIELHSGLTKTQINQAADIACDSKKTICCWAMGMTQHKNAVANIQLMTNFLMLQGNLGKPGAGVCPVRGHSNVQGDRTMGIWEKASDSFLDSLEKEFNFKSPRKHGLDVINSIEAMHQKKAKVFIGMGGNFVSATPDTEYTANALRNCNLTVHISTKLNRSHLIHGKKALILPCLGRSEKDIQTSGEQFISVENSMGVVHQSHGHLEPHSDKLLSEPKIVAGIANATLKNSTVNWTKLTDNYDLIRDKIEATITGFDNFNKRVRIKGGFYLPNNARENDFSPTETGKANFSLNKPSGIKLKKNEFMMMTIRTHDQYNTTIYGLNDRYRGVLNERRVIFMNANDMSLLGLKRLDLVDLTSHFNNEKRQARGFLVVPYNIPKQCTATYFPEANVLVSIKSKANISNTPASKTVIITVKKR